LINDGYDLFDFFEGGAVLHRTAQLGHYFCFSELTISIPQKARLVKTLLDTGFTGSPDSGVATDL
jgi:hypothetical protein